MIDQKYNHIVNDGVSITIPRSPTNYTGKAVISKVKGSYSDSSLQGKRDINLLLESALTTGEVVTYDAIGESYLCTVSRPETINGVDVSIIARGHICNTTLTVTRTETTYDENGNPSGETTTGLIELAPCRADHVTYRMRQEDPGLLPGTVLKVYAMDVPSLALLDKATIAGAAYRVDDINRLEIPGAMVLQLSVHMDEGIEG